jgi:hypothetical protein
MPPHGDADNIGLDVRERADVTLGVSRADKQARDASENPRMHERLYRIVSPPTPQPSYQR